MESLITVITCGFFCSLLTWYILLVGKTPSTQGSILVKCGIIGVGILLLFVIYGWTATPLMHEIHNEPITPLRDVTLKQVMLLSAIGAVAGYICNRLNIKEWT